MVNRTTGDSGDSGERPLVPTLTAVSFEPVSRSERLADRVARTLTESILSGQLNPGDRLPPERELCEQFGVSRPVLREAVRSLIAKGLLDETSRRGHIVSALGRETVTESLSLYLRGQRLDYGKLMEVRSVIEVENAGFAAERAGEAQIEALRAAAEGLRVGMAAEEAAIADVGFHRAIATSTGNEFFEMLLDSIRDALIVAQLPTLARDDIVQGAIDHHRKILARIEARDPDGAREAMREHLRSAVQGMRQVLGR